MSNLKYHKQLFCRILFYRYLCFLIIFAVGAYYLWNNSVAPVQRDGAHFLFMANNIINGQSPYWASFETKNPLVEIFWLPFIYLFKSAYGIIVAARIAETFWIVVTSYFIFILIYNKDNLDIDRNTLMSSMLALLVSLLYLLLALDVRVTDDGLNISLYQSLPEIVLILVLYKLSGHPGFLKSSIIGVLIFLSWFVKQTSLITAVLLLIVYSGINFRQTGLKWLLSVFISLFVCVFVFFIYLFITETLYNYLVGTHLYRIGLLDQLLAEFFSNAYKSYTVPLINITLPAFLISHRVWTGIAMLIMVPIAIYNIFAFRENDYRNRNLLLALVVVWVVGSWFQSIAQLNFFTHYFLASLAPITLLLGLLLSRMGPQLIKFCILILSLLVVALFYSYIGIRSHNLTRNLLAPINISTLEVMSFINPSDRVFNWSGLPHVLVACNRPSDFALNMNWPYIMSSLSDTQRLSMLKATLAIPPDIVVSMNEKYPKNQGLDNYPMSVDKLKELTGKDYVLVYESVRRTGRYGEPVSVYRLKSE